MRRDCRNLSYWRFSERNLTSTFCTFFNVFFGPLHLSRRSRTAKAERFNALTIVFGRFPSPSPLPRGFSGHVACPSRSIRPFNVREAMRPHFLFLSLGYSSLLGQCLRLVSYATGALPHLRLRAFHRRSSLPSLCYRITGNSVAAL